MSVGLAGEFNRLYDSETCAAASGIVAPDWGPDGKFYLKRLVGVALEAAIYRLGVVAPGAVGLKA